MQVPKVGRYYFVPRRVWVVAPTAQAPTAGRWSEPEASFQCFLHFYGRACEEGSA
jgi:hypothetical protein